MADRMRRDKNEKETGEPFQLDKEPKPGQQHEERRPMEHERPQHEAEPQPGGYEEVDAASGMDAPASARRLRAQLSADGRVVKFRMSWPS
jgi:hypothetical protein